MKHLLFPVLWLATMALCLMLFTAALCHAQFTYPYVLTPPNITCSPASCNNGQFLGSGGYGTTSVFAQGSCASGIRPYVQPAQTDFFCAYPNTYIYAYAFIGSQPTAYPLSFGTVYAQTVEGHNGTYAYIAGNWVSIFAGVQFSDCYTGALRTFEPPPHPC